MFAVATALPQLLRPPRSVRTAASSGKSAHYALCGAVTAAIEFEMAYPKVGCQTAPAAAAVFLVQIEVPLQKLPYSHLSGDRESIEPCWNGFEVVNRQWVVSIDASKTRFYFYTAYTYRVYVTLMMLVCVTRGSHFLINFEHKQLVAVVLSNFFSLRLSSRSQVLFFGLQPSEKLFFFVKRCAISFGGTP